MKNDITDILAKSAPNKKALVKKREEFDFDYWSNLAKKDPEAFEQAREARINKHIENIKNDDSQERMRKLQWRVEMERKLSKNPMDAAIRIYDMMWESVGKNMDAMNELAELLNPEQSQKSSKHTAKPDAKILTFRKEDVAEIN